MNCPDCSTTNGSIVLLFDAKQMGEVCPRCTRVFLLFNNDPNHRHYATEKGCKARMRLDQAQRRGQSVSTRALVERILRPID